jgi:hypothetical protein
VTAKACARALAVLFSAACLVSTGLAQTSWWKTYGGSHSEEAHSVQRTTDGGYILVGSTYSFGPGTPDSQNLYLVKTDSLGDTLWTRAFGGAGVEVANSVQQTSDGGYIVTGGTTSFGAGSRDVYLVKTDSAGDTLWTRTYGGEYGDCGYWVQQTADHGYAITGFTSSPVFMIDFYLIRTDSLGDTLWTRTYGGTGTDFGLSGGQTCDGGYILAGSTFSFGPGVPDSDNVYLVRTDAQGDTLWTRSFGGQSWDEGYSVEQTRDSGFIVAGLTQSFGAGAQDIYLIKTDALGDSEWIRTYGDTLYEYANCVRPTSDGGYIVTGYTSSFGALYGDVYVVKTSASGDTLWTKRYGSDVNSDWGDCVQQTADGGYIIAGGTYSYGAGGEDFYLIKTDSLGLVGIAEPNPKPQVTSHKLAATVVCRLPQDGTAYDAMGRRALHPKPGVYFLRRTAVAGPQKVLLVR